MWYLVKKNVNDIEQLLVCKTIPSCFDNTYEVINEKEYNHIFDKWTKNEKALKDPEIIGFFPKKEKDEEYDYYRLYLYNLWVLIKKYQYKYCWKDISAERFFNHSGKSFTNFQTPDKFLQLYQNDKEGLGQAILKDGTYTPFFYFKDFNDLNMVMLGKHRLFSLLTCCQREKIARKFLFVEYPIDPLNLKEAKEKKVEESFPLYYFSLDEVNPKLIYPQNIHEINQVFLRTGDFLSDYFYTKKICPALCINSPEAFEDFLLEKNDLELN